MEDLDEEARRLLEEFSRAEAPSGERRRRVLGVLDARTEARDRTRRRRTFGWAICMLVALLLGMAASGLLR